MKDKRIAVVTGASRGLGLGTTRKLAELGYHVVLGARDEKKGADIQKSFANDGLAATFIRLDVTSVESIESFVHSVLEKPGRVDVLVNNAGVFLDHDKSGDLKTIAGIIEKTYQTNSLGPYLLCRLLVPSMVKNNYGRIVNVSSGMGQLSEMNSGYPGYRMSKTALNAVTRMFADETKGTNVLVNSVCPGWVQTDMGGAGATRTIEEGIKGIVWAATLPDDAPTGGFFRDGKKLEF